MKTKTIKLSEEVRTVLARSTIAASTVVLPPQLDRALYLLVDKALRAAGGKWDKREKAHVFQGNAREALGLALAAGEVVDKRATFQAFYTPPEVADRMVELLFSGGPCSIRTVMEPSAGRGALVDGLSRRGDLSYLSVSCVELDPEAAAFLAQKGRAQRFTVIHDDFLTTKGLVPGFDGVIMNPPFADGQDADHVKRAFSFLRLGGVLVAIVSSMAGLRSTAKDRAFAKLMDGYCDLVEDLPAGTFKDSGTNALTKIIRLRRLAKPRT